MIMYYKDNAVVLPSYLYNGNFCTDKTVSLYWDGLQNGIATKTLTIILHACGEERFLTCNSIYFNYLHRINDEDTNKMQCNVARSGWPSQNISCFFLRYQWTRDGQPLDYDNIGNIMRTSDGTLLIDPATSIDEGYYQCTAKNDYGSALTTVTFLERACEYAIISMD